MNWLRPGLVLVLILLAVAGVGAAWFFAHHGADEITFRTATVSRGDIVATIGSTGTVEPEEVVDVGAQVAGQIAAFGTDADGHQVDHGSRVKEGTLLAQIDDSLYRSDVDVAKAQVTAAEAGVQRAEADQEQSQAKLYQAQRDWERAQKLGPSEALAEFSYDAYKATYESAVAAVAVAKAAIAQAIGTVAQAKAQLFRAERNLGYTTIKSPIDGVIIERRVNIGQTVVASLNAPSLFLLAKDLAHMQVWVSVNEADIGRIQPGQPVTFTVDTFPNRTFHGRVRKIRPKAEMTQNVVTYLVEVATDNTDKTLWPYLTATVQFEVGRRENVLRVPNAALRYQPSEEKIIPDARMQASAQSTTAPSDGPRREGRRRRGADASTRATSRPAESEWHGATIWIKEGKYVKPLPVMAGMTDGIVTEIKGDGVSDKMEVVTGEVTPDQAAASGNTNPFGPPQFGRSRGGGGRH